MTSLDESRVRINSIDSQIVKLLEERMECVKIIGQWKKENNLTALNPRRENELLTRLAGNTTLSSELIADIWRKIMSYAVGLQCNFKVAVVNVEDVSKAKGYFGNGVEVIICATTQEALKQLENGEITTAFLSINMYWWQDIYKKYNDMLVYSSVDYGTEVMFTIAKLDKSTISGNRTLVALNTSKDVVWENIKTDISLEAILLKHHREAVSNGIYWLLQFNEFVEENSSIFQTLKEYNVKLLGRYNILNQK